MKMSSIRKIVGTLLGQLVPIALIFMLIGLCHYVERNTEEPLIKAVRAKDIKQVENLLRNNPDVNIMTGSNLTPLHIASENGTTEIVELLIKNGADINAKTLYDVTPLHFAAQGGNTAIAELLIAKGAQIDAKDNQGRTPLGWITGKDWASPQMIDLLELHEDALIILHEAKSKDEYDRIVEFFKNDKGYRESKNTTRKRSEQEFQEYITRLKNLK